MKYLENKLIFFCRKQSSVYYNTIKTYKRIQKENIIEYKRTYTFSH